MERTILILVASWFAFNALVAGLLLTRRSRSRHALYRWVAGAPAPARPQQFARVPIVAYRRRR